MKIVNLIVTNLIVNYSWLVFSLDWERFGAEGYFSKKKMLKRVQHDKIEGRLINPWKSVKSVAKSSDVEFVI